MSAMERVPILEQDDTDNAVECIFLGTGTSSSLPHIECLTAPPHDRKCKTCLSTLRPDGKKNIRRNTSAVFRMHDRHGFKKTIVVDVGKNFQAAALEWFPRYGLRRIDAVLITHAHADAMNGLDDLRGWTLNNNIQPYIDIYLSLPTFVEVQRAFPYLVAREFASGGGDVPEFKWHIIDDKVSFEIGDTGIQITPFAVQHGRLFSRAPSPTTYLPTPAHTAPSTPISGRSTPSSPSTLPRQGDLQINGTQPSAEVNPYICFGFKIADAVVYISDVSHIPEETWSTLLKPRSDRKFSIPVFVVDCLRLQPHTSHFGLKESVAAVRRMCAQRSYLTGFGHEIPHEDYEIILQQVGLCGEGVVKKTSDNVSKALQLIELGEPVWTRPAFDGLRVVISADRNHVEDNAY